MVTVIVVTVWIGEDGWLEISMIELIAFCVLHLLVTAPSGVKVERDKMYLTLHVGKRSCSEAGLSTLGQSDCGVKQKLLKT